MDWFALRLGLSGKDGEAFACRLDLLSTSLTPSCRAPWTPPWIPPEAGRVPGWAQGGPGDLGAGLPSISSWARPWKSSRSSLYPSPHWATWSFFCWIQRRSRVSPSHPQAPARRALISVADADPRSAPSQTLVPRHLERSSALRLARTSVLTFKCHHPTWLIALGSIEAASDLIPAPRAPGTGERGTEHRGYLLASGSKIVKWWGNGPAL